RPVQLLQLRQLGLSALVRVVEHAVVLQRHSPPVLPDGASQDRAVADQRLAIVLHVQLGAWRRGTDPLSYEWLAVDKQQRLLRTRLARHSRALAPPFGQQSRGQVLREFEEDTRPNGVLD